MKNEKLNLRFTRDYPLAGKKKGDPIQMAKIPRHLKNYLEEVKTAPPSDEVPTEKNTKEEILKYLSDNGVTDAVGTKDELLKLVKKVSK